MRYKITIFIDSKQPIEEFKSELKDNIENEFLDAVNHAEELKALIVEEVK